MQKHTHHHSFTDSSPLPVLANLDSHTHTKQHITSIYLTNNHKNKKTHDNLTDSEQKDLNFTF